MRKFIASIVALMLILLSFSMVNTVKATDVDTSEYTADLQFTSDTTEDSVTLTISTGDFVGIEENSVLNIEGTLGYDSSQVTGYELVENAGWDITVSLDSNRLLIETDTATSNTEIGSITFNLDRSALEETVSGEITIEDLKVSNGFFEESYTTLTLQYSLVPIETEEPSIDIDGNMVINTGSDTQDEEEESTGVTSSSNLYDSKDNTVVEGKLPQTGVNIAITFGIVAIVILAIVGIIRYKSIEVK